MRTRRPSRRPRSAADRTCRLPSPRPAPPTGVGERCPSTRLTFEQPAQQRSARRRGRRGDRGCGRPRSAPPAGRRSRTTGEVRATASHGSVDNGPIVATVSASRSRARARSVVVFGEHLGGAERSERHRPTMGRSLLRLRGRSTTTRSHASPVIGARERRCRTPRGCGPSSPRRRGDRASDRRRRAGCGSARSRSAPRRGIGRPSALSSCIAWLCVGLADGHDQQSRHVVGAVPVLAPRLDVVGVLEHPDARRSSTARDRTTATSRASPRLARCASDAGLPRSRVRAGRLRPTTGRGRAGAPRRPSTLPAEDRVSTDRIARPSATGSRCGTTIPAPLASSSTACGNAVDTTGRPAATASTSTPDVTWSLGVVGEHHQVGGLDQLGQRRRGRGTCRRR